MTGSTGKFRRPFVLSVPLNLSLNLLCFNYFVVPDNLGILALERSVAHRGAHSYPRWSGEMLRSSRFLQKLLVLAVARCASLDSAAHVL